MKLILYSFAFDEHIVWWPLLHTKTLNVNRNHLRIFVSQYKFRNRLKWYNNASDIVSGLVNLSYAV
jgi:hypothetical protein